MERQAGLACLPRVPSALLVLGRAEQNGAGLFVDLLGHRRPIGKHLEPALDRRPRRDPVELPFHVGEVREVLALGPVRTEPGKKGDVGDRIVAAREIRGLPAFLAQADS